MRIIKFTTLIFILMLILSGCSQSSDKQNNISTVSPMLSDKIDLETQDVEVLESENIMNESSRYDNLIELDIYDEKFFIDNDNDYIGGGPFDGSVLSDSGGAGIYAVQTTEKEPRTALFVIGHSGNLFATLDFPKGITISSADLIDINGDGLADIYINMYYPRNNIDPLDSSTWYPTKQYDQIIYQIKPGEFEFGEIREYEYNQNKRVNRYKKVIPLPENGRSKEFPYDVVYETEMKGIGKVFIELDQGRHSKGTDLVYITNQNDDILVYAYAIANGFEILFFEVCDLNGDGLDDLYMRSTTLTENATKEERNDFSSESEWGQFYIQQTEPDISGYMFEQFPSLELNKENGNLSPVEQFAIASATYEKENSETTPTTANNISPPINQVVSLDYQTARQSILRSNIRHMEMLGKAEQTEADVWHRLYMSFQLFLSSYKETPAEIVQGLKDLSWHDINDFALYIWDEDHMIKDEPAIKTNILSILENDVIAHWEQKEKGSFSVYLVQSVNI